MPRPAISPLLTLVLLILLLAGALPAAWAQTKGQKQFEDLWVSWELQGDRVSPKLSRGGQELVSLALSPAAPMGSFALAMGDYHIQGLLALLHDKWRNQRQLRIVLHIVDDGRAYSHSAVLATW